MPQPNLVRRVDLVSLQLFVAVCEEGTLTRAAEREFIAPSALSKRLADLEEALEAVLFVRHPKGMSLAPAGETLLHHARAMLESVARMGQELGEHAKGVRGHIRMLANISAIVQFLPDDLPSFVAEHGGVKIDLDERMSDAVVKGVEEGFGEVGICVASVDSRALTTYPYRSDRLVLAVRRDHPLAGRSRIRFVDSLDFDHVGFHADSAIYARSRIAAAQAGREVRLRIHVPGFDAVCRMVESGLGVALIPDRAFDVVAAGMDLVAVPIADDWASRTLKIVVRDPRGLSPATRLLVEHLVARCAGEAAVIGSEQNFTGA